jgi:hypothetical protein
MNMRNLFIFALIVATTACGGESTPVHPSAKTDPYPLLPAQPEKDLNITVLIDLSDRINSSRDDRQPAQAERDISIIHVLSSAIKKNVAAHGAFKSKARFSVYFHPEPPNKEIRDIASNLSVSWVGSTDMGQAKLNKKRYQQLDSNFANGLNDIYSMAQATNSYPGSDIWRFMKDEARMKCVEPDSSYRNILVILTDGYMYYEKGKQQQPNSNRYNYIERGTPHFSKFRNPNVLASEFDQKDYGLMHAATSLSNLEVLVLECRPEDAYPQDFDIMQKYWCKWFGEMGVKHAEIFKSQQPAYHEKMIAGFLRKQNGICQ